MPTTPSTTPTDEQAKQWLIPLKSYLSAGEYEVLRTNNYLNTDPTDNVARLKVELDHLRQMLDYTETGFKKMKAASVWTNFAKRLDTIADGITTTTAARGQVGIIVANINEWVANFKADIRVQSALSTVQNEQQQLSAAATRLDAYSDHTYFLQVGGKAVVLTDEEVKNSNLGLPAPARSYSILSVTDAKNVARNIDYYEVADDGKVKKKNVCDAWLDSTTRCDLTGITCDPSTTNRVVNGQFNIWRGFRDWEAEVPAGTTIDGADAAFWDLTRNVICDGNEDYFHFVQRWLAHLVQQPHHRPLCALGISGPQGCGKTLFVKLIGGLLMPQHYNSQVPMSAVAGTTQGRDLEGILLAYLDEATWGGNREGEGILKKAITGEVDEINEKFVPKYSVPTYKRLIFSSNETYYYHADADDRRLLPLEVDANKPLKTDAFFQQLVNGQSYRPEVQAALLRTLKSVDLTNFIPHQALRNLTIVTGGGLQERSMSSVMRWLKHSLSEGHFEVTRTGISPADAYLEEVDPSGGITIPDLKLSYKQYCDQSSLDRNRLLNLTETEQRTVLETIFGHSAKTIRQNQYTVIRGYRATIDEMRSNFQAVNKWQVKWD